jgi:hypothetical protein
MGERAMIRRLSAAWRAFRNPREAQDQGYAAGWMTCRARFYDLLRMWYNKRNGTVTVTITWEILQSILQMKP